MADQLSHSEAILIPLVAGALARTATLPRVWRSSACRKPSHRFQRNLAILAP